MPEDGPGEATAEQVSPAPAKAFQCSHCSKVYKRADYLARHLRIHDHDRKYVCKWCNRAFHRADIYKRHTKLHLNTSSTATRLAPRQTRTQGACQTCARLHLKCSDNRPCLRCEAKGITCQTADKQQSNASHVEDAASILLSFPRILSSDPLQPTALGRDDVDVSLVSAEMHDGQIYPEDLSLAQAPLNEGPVQADFGTPVGEDNPFALESAASNQDEPESVLSTQMAYTGGALRASQYGWFSGARTPRDKPELGLNTDIILNELDLNQLIDVNWDRHFGGPLVDSSPIPPSTASYATPSALSVSITSLQKASLWRFEPERREGSGMHMSLPSSATYSSPHTNRTTLEKLTNRTRDQILAALVRGAPGGSTIPSCPTLEQLDSLLQFYLTSAREAKAIFHVASFNPNQSRPELVLAMIAGGAMLVPDCALRKLGLAIQETARLDIARALEQDNSLIRNIQVLQASLLLLKIGLWSGNSRKMEIAESFLLPWTTMQRRGRWFDRSCNTVRPLPEDSDDTLEDRWKQWIEEESRARIVFAFYQHDLHQSFAMFTRPIISFSEVQLSFPQAKVLWNAGTAAEWKTAYLAGHYDACVEMSLTRLLHTIDVQAVSPIYDYDVVLQALICASGGLVRHVRELDSTASNRPSPWRPNRLSVDSQREEVSKLIRCVRLAFPRDLFASVDLEIQQMHLFAAFDQIHRFAGIEGQDQIADAFSELKGWTLTSQARQAVWHAGQVVRYISSMPNPIDFYIVAAYQAFLTLWTFGIVSQSGLESGSIAIKELVDTTAEPMFALNLDDNDFVQRWINLGRGIPAIVNLLDGTSEHHARHNIAIYDPTRLMTHFILLLERLHPEPASRLWLIDNLLSLMEDLKISVTGSAVRLETNS